MQWIWMSDVCHYECCWLCFIHKPHVRQTILWRRTFSGNVSWLSTVCFCLFAVASTAWWRWTIVADVLHSIVYIGWCYVSEPKCLIIRIPISENHADFFETKFPIVSAIVRSAYVRWITDLARFSLTADTPPGVSSIGNATRAHTHTHTIIISV